MKKNIFITFFVVIFIFTVQLFGKDEKTILWLHPGQPPLTISHGYGKNTGMIDCTEEFFKKYLSEYQHVFKDANYERIMQEIKQKENACCVPLYRTPERDKFIQFSIPYCITLSNALIIPESKKNSFQPYVKTDGTISLEDIIKNGFRIGIAKGRVYRGIIDEILKKYKNNPRIVEHFSSQNMVSNLITMMIAGRIDAIIGYSFEAQYAINTMEEKIDVISIPITGMDTHGLSAVGCSNTTKGKEIIQKLNSIIIKYRKSPEFLYCVERWLDPMAKQRFKEYTMKEFK